MTLLFENNLVSVWENGSDEIIVMRKLEKKVSVRISPQNYGLQITAASNRLQCECVNGVPAIDVVR